MSYLFEVRGNSVIPDAALLVLSPFAEIWERDKSVDKGLAKKELAYIEFMSSAQRSNPFAGYPESSRAEVIMGSLFSGVKWKPDRLIDEGIEFVKRIQTEGSVTYSYYVAAKKSAESMKDFFMNVDLSERNDKGAPVYKPKDITGALIDTEKVLMNLDALQKKVDEELYDSVKIRSGKTISPFADPESLNMM